MRPPFTKVLQTFALLIGALALVFSSAGIAGAAPGDDTPVTEDTDTNDDSPNNVVDDDDNAHPSGADRSVENGNSGNQGNSPSDPDDDGRGPDRSNGGADKPDGPGGVDLADQDGNNGCGNDDDFEDDNEGLCLGKDGAPGQNKPVDDEDTTVDDDGADQGAEKVTICHATGSATNPFVVITVSTNAILHEGHGSHEDDIIPAFDGFEGQNLDQLHLIDAGCVLGDTDTDTDVGDDVATPGGDDDDGVPVTTPVDTVTPDTGTPEVIVEDDVVVNPVTPLTPVTPAIPATPAVSPASPAVLTSTASPAPQVLGAQVTRTPGALAATGDSTTNLVPFGLGLLLLGFGIQRASTRVGAARIG